jgi:hypothetical protein
MTDIFQKIKGAKTMKEMDDLRIDVIKERTSESLSAWQKKYHGMKCFRKPADKGYKYTFEARQETAKKL